VLVVLYHRRSGATRYPQAMLTGAKRSSQQKLIWAYKQSTPFLQQNWWLCHVHVAYMMPLSRYKAQPRLHLDDSNDFVSHMITQ